MNEYRTAMAAAVVSGYVLGRRKKAGLALALGTYLVGRHLGVAPGRLLPQALGTLRSPQMQDLADQLRDELLTASHAVVSAADRRLADLADTLRDHADALTGMDAPGRRPPRRQDERYEDDYEYGEDDGYGDAPDAQDAQDAYDENTYGQDPYEQDPYDQDGYREDVQEGDEDAYDERDDVYDDERDDVYDEERDDAASRESAPRRR
ncbi:hypothetical protein [Streptomyces sp. IBSBF 3136]|uniref:hypothetical protein n=1 Tax=Streptomyces sp. IBSBF 3136 TaxID=2903524 RepID=UPI002FDC5569